MNLPPGLKIVLLFLFTAFIISASFPLYAAEKKPVEQTKDSPKKQQQEATEEQKTTLIQLYSWATILPKELIDLQSKLTNDETIASVEKQLPRLTEEAEKLRWDSTIAKSTPNLQLMHVTTLQSEAYRITTRLNKLSKPITDAISNLSEKREDWQSKKEQIAGFEKKELLSLALAEEQRLNLVQTVETAADLVEERLKLALGLGKNIGDLQILLYSIDSDLQAINEELKDASTSQTSPSMLSADFYKRMNVNLLRQSYSTTSQFLHGQVESLKNNLNFALISVLLFCVLLFGIYKSKNLTSAYSRWYPFASCPIATSLFLVASQGSFISMLPLKFDVSRQWEIFMHILTMFAVIRLTRHLVQTKWKRRLFKRLTVFMAIAMVMLMLNFPQLIMLLYVFYVSLVALIYYFYKLPSTSSLEGSELWVKRTFGVFPAIVLFSGVLGYDQFAVIAFSTLLSSVITCLIVWTLYLLHIGFLDLLLSLLPIHLFSENREKIVASLQPVIAWLHILLLFAVQGVVWDVFPTANEAFDSIFSLGFDFGSLHISPGFFLTVVFVIYAALLASKAIQTLLLTKILPRYGAEKGVQLSIARLVHYAILTIGFLVMLRVLGFELNQLTLLGGALGIGIGFGLQAIVTNFASGLILLFERPIKVGDTIQLGTELGEVKKLGLRATVIQTFDNSEIVVPNSDLVTGQVTNWTLGERKVRIRISVGVAYGTDVANVLEILVVCANNNPMVLNTPKPTSYFLAFGASSLDFELRVWIPEFLDKTQVLSDLNQDIEAEFGLSNIEIPFPQTDLHFRSIDNRAAEKLRQNSTGLENTVIIGPVAGPGVE